MWTRIFESAADFIPGRIDLRELRDGRSRNKTLTACALVCKTWAPLAQKVLFRDICLGVTQAAPFGDTDSEGDSDDDLQSMLMYDPYRLEDMAKTPTGDTEPALESLIDALLSFQKRGSAIPRNVRAIHLAVGRTGGRGYDEGGYLVHGSTESVAYAVSLCTGLVHFSLMIGAINYDDCDEEISFAAESLASMRRLKRLQQLSIETMDEHDLIERADLCRPVPTAAHQLIRTFAPVLTLLHVVIGTCSEPLECVDDDEQALPSMPKLHTVVACESTDLISTAIRDRSPNVYEADIGFSDMPKSIKLLRCFAPTAADLARFPRLEILEVTSRDVAEVARTVRAAPNSVRELRLFSQVFDHKDAVATLSAALRTRKSLKSVVISRPRDSEFPTPKLPVAVRVVNDVSSACKV